MGKSLFALFYLTGNSTTYYVLQVRSYLTSLSVPVRFEEKNIDCNMFGSRFLYLDLLPPFKTTSANVKDTLMNAESPEFWCQNSLLKLQSLLCSNLCKGASCKSIVQGYLDIKPGKYLIEVILRLINFIYSHVHSLTNT